MGGGGGIHIFFRERINLNVLILELKKFPIIPIFFFKLLRFNPPIVFFDFFNKKLGLKDKNFYAFYQLLRPPERAPYF
ncbi:hypothetical protein, partial [Helicobacter bilis]|uniref:hypothetical protein n=1 Tax=Helicobacter bilis TaxID=37372 RepID=UPI001F2656B8